MKKKVKSEITDLRRNAEELLKKRSLITVSNHSEVETLKLMHELEVHQIELEMQNEELMLAKEVIEVSAKKYTELYDFAPTGYFTLSTEGKIIELNLTGANMLGKERQYLKNKLFVIFVSTYTKPIFNIFLSNVFNRQSKQSCELTLSTKDNLLTDVILTGLKTEHGEHCFLNMVDITERKSAENKLKIKSDELLIADKKLVYQNEEKEKREAEVTIARKELEKFAYIAGHDLQEPLRSVTDFMQVFEDENLELPDKIAFNYIHSVKNATKRMNILINSLIGFTQSVHKPDLTMVQIKELIGEVIADIESVIITSGATIEVTEMPVLNVYEPGIRLLFQNLILNAIKFREKDTRPEIRIHSEKMDEKWKFSVCDNGIGIDPANFEKAPDIFHRLHPDENEYRVTGIGMMYSRKIVQMHNGEIRVDSNSEHGVTVHFTLSNLTL